MNDDQHSEKRKELNQYEDKNSEPVDIQKTHSPIYREFSEPRDGYQPIPTWWLLLMIVILMWGGWYIGEYNADFSPRVYDSHDPESSAQPITDETQEDQPVDMMALGKRIYNNCQSCHKSDGQGVTGQYPPLTDSKWVLGRPEVFALIILHGLQGPIEVQGVVYNNVMPEWSRLSDQDIAAVMTYERNSFGNNASEVSPDLVAKVREQSQDRTQPLTEEDLYEALENLPPVDESNDTVESATTTAESTTGTENSETEKPETETDEMQSTANQIQTATNEMNTNKEP